jgi:CubicO group peptidase (beta-lactamase class C family)
MRSLVSSIVIFAFIVSSGFLCNCVQDAPFKFNYTTIPEQMNDGWQVASPEDMKISRTALDHVFNDFTSEDQYFNAKSLLVIKNGKLVFEAYCSSLQDRDRYAHVASVTKSVTSLVLGILRSEGYFASLDQTLYSIMPEKFMTDKVKRSITIHQLLTMTSGIAFENDVFAVEIHGDKPDDPIKYILKKPMYASPGEKFKYRDCDPYLIGYAIQRLTGRSEESWAKERLFDPLGIKDYYWLTDHAGTTTGPYGLHLKPRDMAKIGQMVLDNGRWKGNQIVDMSWISISTQKQVATNDQAESHVYDYGYYWWILPKWKAFTAWGHGGNFIFIAPEKNMVIVMTSMPDVDDDVVGTLLDDFEELIQPLLVDEEGF